jgi:hypothetical protein
VRSGPGYARLQSPMALSASIDDALRGIACFSLRALRLFALAQADDPLLTHTLKAEPSWTKALSCGWVGVMIGPN